MNQNTLYILEQVLGPTATVEVAEDLINFLRRQGGLLYDYDSDTVLSEMDLEQDRSPELQKKLRFSLENLNQIEAHIKALRSAL